MSRQFKGNTYNIISIAKWERFAISKRTRKNDNAFKTIKLCLEVVTKGAQVIAKYIIKMAAAIGYDVPC